MTPACGEEGFSEEDEAVDALLSTDERRPPQGPSLTMTVSALRYRPSSASSALKPDNTTYASIFASHGELREQYLSCSPGTWLCYPRVRMIPASRIVGTRLTTRDGNYRLRIDAVRAPAGTSFTTTSLIYEVRYQATTWTGWYPLCTGTYNEAIPMSGYFDSYEDVWVTDPTAVTFVCRDSAAFKAISWGYIPEAHPLHFRAAVRAARADYCGSADPYTNPSTHIHVFDRDGIRPDPGDDSEMEFEAAWLSDEHVGPSDEFPVAHGALCLSKLRWQTLAPSSANPGGGPSNCPSLPWSGEFASPCDANSPTVGHEPAAADWTWMRDNGALVYTRSAWMH